MTTHRDIFFRIISKFMNLTRYRWPLFIGFIILGASMYLYSDSNPPDGFSMIWEKSITSEDYSFTVETGSIPVEPDKTPR